MRLSSLAWLLVLALLWGPTFLFNKVAAAEIPILTLTATRVFLAGVTLYTLIHLRGERLPEAGVIWKHIVVMGVITNCIPFLCFTFGSTMIPVCLGGILTGCTPLFTATLAHFTLENEAVTFHRAQGIGLGLIGILVLFLPSASTGWVEYGPGIAVVLMAVLSNALGFVYAKRNLQQGSSLLITCSQLLVAAAILMPTALLLDQPLSLNWPSSLAWSAGLANAIFGTALPFLVYYHLVQTEGATYTSTVTYLLPIIGIGLGIVFMGEQLTWNMALGVTTILLGVLFVRRAQPVTARDLKSES